MLTLMALLLIFGIGFFFGQSVGVKQGYEQAHSRTLKVIDRIEKLYRRESR